MRSVRNMRPTAVESLGARVVRCGCARRSKGSALRRMCQQ